MNRSVSADSFTYYVCPTCRTKFLFPVPADLGRYYPPEYYPIPASHEALVRSLGGERYRMKLLRPFKTSGRVVEIGSGFGQFTWLAHEAGFEVQGVELDTKSSEFVRNTQGIPVITTSRPHEVQLELGAWDVVAMWHTLEHLPEPGKCLAAAASWLRPGGVLLIAVPNPESLQARVLGLDWPHLDAPRHLCLMPLSALTARLKGEGLALAHVTTTDAGGRRCNRFGWSRTVARGAPTPWLVRPLRAAGWGLAALLWPIESLGLLGSTYTAIFVKRQESPAA